MDASVIRRSWRRMRGVFEWGMREDEIGDDHGDLTTGGGDEPLPLSEHEQRILHELEQSLYQEDPDFAERVRSETVYRHAGRYCIWSALVFVAALVFMFFTFSRRWSWGSSAWW